MLHHDRKNHLRCVGAHLGSIVLRVFLGIEGLGLAGIHLEHIGSDSSGDRTADLTLGCHRGGTDKLGIKPLAVHGGEPHINTRVDGGVQSLGNSLEISHSLNLGGHILSGLLQIEAVVVNHRLRLGFDREIAARRLLAEESAREQIAIDRFRCVMG